MVNTSLAKEGENVWPWLPVTFPNEVTAEQTGDAQSVLRRVAVWTPVVPPGGKEQHHKQWDNFFFFCMPLLISIYLLNDYLKTITICTDGLGLYWQKLTEELFKDSQATTKKNYVSYYMPHSVTKKGKKQSE